LLVALQLQLACLKVSSENAANKQLFCELDRTLKDLHSQVRAVASSIETPSSFQNGLPAALVEMAARFAIVANLKITQEMARNYVPQRHEVEMSLFRIAQEALANVARHADASEVTLQLDCDGRGALRLTIEDDGIGFGTRDADVPDLGRGLHNIRQRVSEMGGHLKLRRLGHRSQVIVTLSAAL
jgi:two-component system NarL family sensor kinase